MKRPLPRALVRRLSRLAPFLLWQAAAAAEDASGAVFLEIPVGAAPAAMGGAYTALAVDAYAPAYNPAGLGEVEVPQIAAQHLDHFGNIRLEHFSGAAPLGGNGGVGVSIHWFGTGNVERTDATGAVVGGFSNAYTAVGLSYGLRVVGDLSAGVTGKMVRGSLASVRSTAYAADLGLLYRPRPWMNWGAAASNLGGAFKFVQRREALPQAFILGAALRPATGWTLTVEGARHRPARTEVRGGVECRIFRPIALRLGGRSGASEAASGLTAGIGLQWRGQEVSYAWLPSREIGDSHYVSILWRFRASTIEEDLGFPPFSDPALYYPGKSRYAEIPR